MRLLLDTHVLVWWRDDFPHLSVRAKAEITDPINEILVSTADSLGNRNKAQPRETDLS